MAAVLDGRGGCRLFPANVLVDSAAAGCPRAAAANISLMMLSSASLCAWSCSWSGMPPVPQPPGFSEAGLTTLGPSLLFSQISFCIPSLGCWYQLRLLPGQGSSCVQTIFSYGPPTVFLLG